MCSKSDQNGSKNVHFRSQNDNVGSIFGLLGEPGGPWGSLGVPGGSKGVSGGLPARFGAILGSILEAKMLPT